MGSQEMSQVELFLWIKSTAWGADTNLEQLSPRKARGRMKQVSEDGCWHTTSNRVQSLGHQLTTLHPFKEEERTQEDKRGCQYTLPQAHCWQGRGWDLTAAIVSSTDL